MNPGSTTAVKDEREAVKAGLGLLTTAVKNCALYPETNQIRREALAKLHAWLAGFLEENETLRLFVEWDGLLYQGEMVYREKTGEQALMFPLFRDGVQWLEFQEELTLEELERFIDLLNRFRFLREEAEDDLVTALWEADLGHISYKTANEFWEIDPLTEVAALRVWSGRESPEPEEVARPLEAVLAFPGRAAGQSWMNPGDGPRSLTALTVSFAAGPGASAGSPAPPAEATGWRNLAAVFGGRGEAGADPDPGFRRLTSEEEKFLRDLAAWEERQDDLTETLAIVLAFIAGA
ncbi:MAG: hypothetical protein LBV21_00040, partial [Candidatus Adiutrix sp.]|nr:hypothetical protein [Candidatus Adiutrix sp.]